MTQRGAITLAAATFAVSLLPLSRPATAATHHHRHYRHHHHFARHHHFMGDDIGIVRRDTLAGPIRVAAKYADRFVGFINDLVNEGHHPKDIGCFSPHGHMPGSKHHWGGACDIDQTDRNKTAAYMYHVTELAHEHGLTDGCEWIRRSRSRYSGPDCGHVEVPTRTLIADRDAHAHYAARHHRVRYAVNHAYRQRYVRL